MTNQKEKVKLNAELNPTLNSKSMEAPHRSDSVKLRRFCGVFMLCCQISNSSTLSPIDNKSNNLDKKNLVIAANRRKSKLIIANSNLTSVTDSRQKNLKVDNTSQKQNVIKDIEIYKKENLTPTSKPILSDSVIVSTNQNSSKDCSFLFSPSLNSEEYSQFLELTRESEYTKNCLLGEPAESDRDKVCLVIDLDETLVHSSFEFIENHDFTIDVEIDGQLQTVYVSKRPYLDDFLNAVGPLFECVLFTASLQKYADPVTDRLDPTGQVFRHRLFREACCYFQGSYVKNLDVLGRPLERCVIVDNSPFCYCFHPHHAVPIASWFSDRQDDVLLRMIAYFQQLAVSCRQEDVIQFLGRSHPPGLEAINRQERLLVSSVGNTVFSRYVQ